MYVEVLGQLAEAVADVASSRLVFTDGIQTLRGWLLFDRKVDVIQVVVATEYRGPTNSTGARILVRDYRHRMAVPYKYGLGDSARRTEAALEFVKKFEDPSYDWFPSARTEVPRKNTILITLTGVRNGDY